MFQMKLNRLALATVGMLFAAGCAETETLPVEEKKAAAAEKSAPETFAEAVDQLVKLDTTVRTAFAAKDEDTAHGPLHDVGHLLEDTVALSAKADLTEDQRQAVQKAVDSLFDAYGAVDEMMHGGDGKTYDEVVTDIDAALAVLKSANKTDGATDNESDK